MTMQSDGAGEGAAEWVGEAVAGAEGDLLGRVPAGLDGQTDPGRLRLAAARLRAAPQTEVLHRHTLAGKDPAA